MRIDSHATNLSIIMLSVLPQNRKRPIEIETERLVHSRIFMSQFVTRKTRWAIYTSRTSYVFLRFPVLLRFSEATILVSLSLSTLLLFSSEVFPYLVGYDIMLAARGFAVHSIVRSGRAVLRLTFWTADLLFYPYDLGIRFSRAGDNHI